MSQRRLMHVDSWNTHTLDARYNSGAFWSSTCLRDSGGPITYTNGVGGTSFVAGTTVGSSDPLSGSCPEFGDHIAFNRTASKIWMLDRLRTWMENKNCTRHVASTLPGDGRCFKCW